MRVNATTRRKRVMAAMLFVVVSTSSYALLANWASGDATERSLDHH